MSKAVKNTSYRVKVGERLRVIREEQGWTVEQVAIVSGFTANTILKVERGEFNTPIDVIATLCDMYGVTFDLKEKEE